MGGEQRQYVWLDFEKFVLPEVDAEATVSASLMQQQLVLILNHMVYLSQFEPELKDQIGRLEIQLEEVELPAGSEVTGKTLKESAIRKTTGATILSIKTVDGQLLTNPPASHVLEPGDRLILVGTTEQLEKVHQKIIPPDNQVS